MQFRIRVAQCLKNKDHDHDQIDRGSDDAKKKITIDLIYQNNQPKISEVKLFSTPGRRIYGKVTQLPWGKTPYSLIIVSTSKGLMSQKEAKTKKLGGEIIAEVY